MEKLADQEPRGRRGRPGTAFILLTITMEFARQRAFRKGLFVIATTRTRRQTARVQPPSELLEFRSSPIHGTGGFARVAIPSGARLIEYVGEKISKEESRKRCAAGNGCVFYLDDTWDLDGAAPANPARFLNHSCAPNCDVECVEGRLWVVARRRIEPAEELTFNYGYELQNLEEHPCRCGAAGCVGFMVAAEFHDLVRRRYGAGRAQPGSPPSAAQPLADDRKERVDRR